MMVTTKDLASTTYSAADESRTLCALHSNVIAALEQPTHDTHSTLDNAEQCHVAFAITRYAIAMTPPHRLESRDQQTYRHIAALRSLQEQLPAYKAPDEEITGCVNAFRHQWASSGLAQTVSWVTLVLRAYCSEPVLHENNAVESDDSLRAISDHFVQRRQFLLELMDDWIFDKKKNITCFLPGANPLTLEDVLAHSSLKLQHIARTSLTWPGLDFDKFLAATHTLLQEKPDPIQNLRVAFARK